MPESLTPPKRRSWLQWNLQTLLLLTTVVAVWVGYWRYRREIPVLERDIQAMKQMARELIVEDPDQVAVVKLQELWMDDQRWDVYLPEGEYAIRLATRQIGKEGLAPIVAETPIGFGRHRIEQRRSQEGDKWKIVILVDDQPSIQVEESAEWYPGHGSETSGASSISTQLPSHRPIELQRDRFCKPMKTGFEPPPEPSEGVLLWIQRVAD